MVDLNDYIKKMNNKKLKLILGPMRSGKSMYLMREAEKLHLSNKKYVYLRPENDTRDFLSRSFVPCTDLNIHFYNKNEDYYEYDYLIIDELHLFDKDIIDICIHHKNVIAGGLSAGFDIDKPFDINQMVLLRNVIDLLPFASKIIKLSAICDKCGSDKANFSIPRGGIIEIGDNYDVLCGACYLRLRNDL